MIFVKIRLLKEFRGDYIFEFYSIINIKTHTKNAIIAAKGAALKVTFRLNVECHRKFLFV